MAPGGYVWPAGGKRGQWLLGLAAIWSLYQFAMVETDLGKFHIPDKLGRASGKPALTLGILVSLLGFLASELFC